MIGSLSSSSWWSRLRSCPALWLWVIAMWVAGATQAADFLPPDRAFRLSARAVAASTIELRYDIAPGYYMYRERFEVTAAPTGVALGPVAYPEGQVKFDENFQKNVETYRGSLYLRVPVKAAAAVFKLSVTSQGCADAGLCYPPRTQALKVALRDDALGAVTLLSDEDSAGWQAEPATIRELATGGAIAAVDPGPDSNDSFEGSLRSGNPWVVVGVFLLAGVLLSLTPCVLPMLPILSSIVVGGHPVSRGRGLALALTYSAGMAAVYTAFGVAAGLAGEGLAGALQTPLVLIAFALLLGLLALSSFGVFELQLPATLRERLSRWSARLPGGRYGGVFAMGGVSALIVSPCVAAPLAGALLYISQTRDVALGASALFSLACGMSVPLIVLGLSAGAVLPRIGPWMQDIRRFFGVVMLAMALWILMPVMPSWAQLLAWGAYLIGIAVFLRAFDRLPDNASGSARLRKALGVVLALVGMAQIVGVLSGGRDMLRPLSHLRGITPAAAATVALPFQRVSSVAELDAALQGPGRMVMLDFYADWCVSCKEMEAFTYSDPRVQARLAGMLLLKADVTANNANDRALLKRFNLFGPPGTVFFDTQGREVPSVRVIGFQDAAQFLRSLDRLSR